MLGSNFMLSPIAPNKYPFEFRRVLNNWHHKFKFNFEKCQINPWAVYCEDPATCISHVTVVTWLSVCVQMAATTEAAILPVWSDAKLRRRLWNHLFCMRELIFELVSQLLRPRLAPQAAATQRELLHRPVWRPSWLWEVWPTFALTIWRPFWIRGTTRLVSFPRIRSVY